MSDIDPEALLATAQAALADRWPEFTMRTDRVIALAAALVEARARIEALEGVGLSAASTTTSTPDARAALDGEAPDG